MPALALLIDGENVPAKFWPELSKSVAALGDPVAICIFGDFSENRLSDWVGVARGHCLEVAFQVSGGKGKNTTDIALTIRAMELLHAGHIDEFCLASSDRDFIPLATKLRQHGKKVYGFGEAKADGALRQNFTRFFTLGDNPVGAPTTVKPDIASTAKDSVAKDGNPLHPKIADLLRSLNGADPAGSTHLSVLAATIRREAPDLAAQLCGKGKFLKNLRQTGQIEQIGEGGAIRVRLRRCGPAATA